MDQTNFNEIVSEISVSKIRRTATLGISAAILPVSEWLEDFI
ncbi:MAG TPA: hypothetical protein VF941_01410 [Clostridia bacterium]